MPCPSSVPRRWSAGIGRGSGPFGGGSRDQGGRPKTAAEIRKLIREMSLANPFWGAPRIHGELLKLGINVSQTTVAKYMARPRRPPSQGWRTFLINHAAGIASIDLFVVPTSTQASVRPPCAQSLQAVDRCVWGDRASDLRVACSTDHGSVSVGSSPPLPNPRSL